MIQINWQFAGNQIYSYDKATFENTVSSLIHRVKPKGFRLLNVDFTEKSESVYVVMVSLGTTEYLQFRISSHETFGKRIYKNYNTRDFTGIVALEKHIENDLKQAAGSKKNRLESKITFHYQEDDFIFYRKLGYLTNIKKRFIMLDTGLVREPAKEDGKKALLVDEHNQVKGTFVGGDFCNNVFSMLAKGFLTVHPISKEFCLIGTTRLFRNLSGHYGYRFSESAQKLNMETYFSTRLTFSERPLRGTELWPLDNSYYLGNMIEELHVFLDSRQAKLSEFIVENKEITAIMIKEAAYLRLKLNPAFTSRYKTMLQLKSDLAYQVHEIKNYTPFGFEDFLAYKLLLKLENSQKHLLLPLPLQNGIKIIGSSPNLLIETFTRGIDQGLVITVEDPQNPGYLMPVTTDLCRKLYEAAYNKFETRFLEELGKNALPAEFVEAYHFNPYEMILHYKGGGFKLLQHLKSFFRPLKNKKPNLVAYVATPPPNHPRLTLKTIFHFMEKNLNSILPGELEVARLEFNGAIIEVTLLSTKNPLDFVHFTISTDKYPTMMKLFRLEHYPDEASFLKDAAVYLQRCVSEQGFFRHFKFADYEVCRWFENLNRVKKNLRIQLDPTDLHLKKLTSCDLFLESDQSFLVRLDNPRILEKIRYGLLNGLICMTELESGTFLLQSTAPAKIMAAAFVGRTFEYSEPVELPFTKRPLNLTKILAKKA